MPTTRGRLPNLGSKVTSFFQTETVALTDIGTGTVTLAQIANIEVPDNAKVMLKAWSNMVLHDTPRQFQFQRDAGNIGQATLADNVEASRISNHQDIDTTGIANLTTGFVDLHVISSVTVEAGDIVLLMASDVMAVDSTTARTIVFSRDFVQVGQAYKIDNSSGTTVKTETFSAMFVDVPGAGTYRYAVVTSGGSATDDFVEGNFEIIIIKKDAALTSKTNYQLYIDEPVAGTYTYSYVTFNGNATDDIGDRVLEIEILQE